VAESPRFDAPAVAQVATRRTQKGGVAEGQLFTFEVQFKPNQDAFTAAQYEQDFERAVNLAATYGGAVITVEGHADPLAFLQRPVFAVCLALSCAVVVAPVLRRLAARRQTGSG